MRRPGSSAPIKAEPKRDTQQAEMLAKGCNLSTARGCQRILWFETRKRGHGAGNFLQERRYEMHRQSTRWNVLKSAPLTLSSMLEDVLVGRVPAKLQVFLSAWALSPAKRAALAVQRGPGVTRVWCYAPGYLYLDRMNGPTRAALSTGGRARSKFLCAAFNLGHARR